MSLNSRSMFVIDLDCPDWPIHEVQCKIFTGPTGIVWAILPNEKRKMVGASAFFNEASAKRSQIAAAITIYKSSYKARFAKWQWNGARQFLESQKISVKISVL